MRFRRTRGVTITSMNVPAATTPVRMTSCRWGLMAAREPTMTSATGQTSGRPSCRRGFTLIELILVLTLLAVAASLIAPMLSGLVRGRALDSEARRLLSVTRAAQSRAISEGMPMLLWVNAAQGTYGVEKEATA